MMHASRRREALGVGIVLVVAVALRVVLLDDVGVLSDWGYWAYDVRLIADGATPYVDIPGRSPLMTHLLVAVTSLTTFSVTTVRGTVILLWLLTAIPVYLLTRHVTDTSSAIAALACFLLLPYPVAYGMALNSQALGALTATTAVYLTYRSQHPAAYTTAGILIALAYLSRRTALVYIPVIGLWTLWQQHRATPSRRAALTATVLRGTIAAVAGIVTLFAGYLMVTDGDVVTAARIFRMDVWGLIATGGRGAFPLLDVQEPEATGAAANTIPVWCLWCQSWTPDRGLKLLVAGGPVAATAAWYTRDAARRWLSPTDRRYVLGGLAAFLIYLAWLAIQYGFYLRVLSAIGLLALGAVIWHATPTNHAIYRPGTIYIAGIFLAIAVGYLVRPRNITVYYLMDAWPAVSILTGIVLTETWRHSSTAARGVLLAAIGWTIGTAIITVRALQHVTLHASGGLL